MKSRRAALLILALAAAPAVPARAMDTTQKSLTRAAAARWTSEDAPAMSEAMLRAAYDGGKDTLPVAARPSRRRLQLVPSAPDLRDAPRNTASSTPSPAIAAPASGPGVEDAVRVALQPYRAVLDALWSGTWGGVTRLQTLSAR